VAQTRLADLVYSCRHTGEGRPVRRRPGQLEVDGMCPICEKRAAAASRPSPPTEFLPRQPDPFRSPWAPPADEVA
jgi:hypothetical protein